MYIAFCTAPIVHSVYEHHCIVVCVSCIDHCILCMSLRCVWGSLCGPPAIDG